MGRLMYTIIFKLNLSLAAVLEFSSSCQVTLCRMGQMSLLVFRFPSPRLWKQIHYLYSTYPNRDDRNHIEITVCT